MEDNSNNLQDYLFSLSSGELGRLIDKILLQLLTDAESPFAAQQYIQFLKVLLFSAASVRQKGSFFVLTILQISTYNKPDNIYILITLCSTNTLRKYFFIIPLVISLMLIAAGIGALAAGEIIIGAIFLIVGLVILMVDLYLMKKLKLKLLPQPPSI